MLLSEIKVPDPCPNCGETNQIEVVEPHPAFKCRSCKYFYLPRNKNMLLLKSFYDSRDYDIDDHIYRDRMLVEFVEYCRNNTIEKSSESFLAEQNRKLKESGGNLAEAAMRVARDYDGVHRLLLAVSEWTKTLANEGGRGEFSKEGNEDNVAVGLIPYPGEKVELRGLIYKVTDTNLKTGSIAMHLIK